jgi:hypothetical protein
MQIFTLLVNFFFDFNRFTFQILQIPFLAHLIYSVTLFLLNSSSYIYLFVKFYRVLCYSKMTFEWLPMINPYIWPFSFFRILTDPYFYFWAKLLPSIKFEKSSVDISGIVGLEVLNSFIHILVRVTNLLIGVLETIHHMYDY